MWLSVTPYLRQCGPPAFSATLPPIVHAAWLDGSGAQCNPCGATARDNATLTTPGSTTARQFSASTDTTRLNRLRPISTTPSASAPPDNPVPAPRGTNGM